MLKTGELTSFTTMRHVIWDHTFEEVEAQVHGNLKKDQMKLKRKIQGQDLSVQNGDKISL